MSDLDPSEVLLYLNELGYQNITAKQLKEFMKDLKKLIKYEKKHMETANVPLSTSPCQYERFACSNPAPTESSKPGRKEQIVSVEIKRPTRPCHCVDKPKPISKQSLHSNTYESQISSNEQKFNSEVTEFNSEEATVSPKRPKSCDVDCPSSNGKLQRNVLRPKSSYIVPRQPIKTCKSDPVALYHKYQQLWKRQKLPGEDNHSDLRWAIRERMLGRPKAMSAAPSMEVIAKKRKTTNQI